MEKKTLKLQKFTNSILNLIFFSAYNLLISTPTYILGKVSNFNIKQLKQYAFTFDFFPYDPTLISTFKKHKIHNKSLLSLSQADR